MYYKKGSSARSDAPLKVLRNVYVVWCTSDNVRYTAFCVRCIVYTVYLFMSIMVKTACVIWVRFIKQTKKIFSPLIG